MKFGPFESYIIERLEKELNKDNIPFTVYTDSDELKRQESEFQQKSDFQPYNPGFNYEGRAFYIDIDERNLEMLGTKLENYGIIGPNVKNYPLNDFQNHQKTDVKSSSFLTKILMMGIAASALYLIYRIIFTKS